MQQDQSIKHDHSDVAQNLLRRRLLLLDLEGTGPLPRPLHPLLLCRGLCS